MTTALHHLPAIVLALITICALLAIGALIWQSLPRRSQRERDIERQIATLRNQADRDVARRPRVRANGTLGAIFSALWHRFKAKQLRATLLRTKRLIAVREAKKHVKYQPKVRGAWRRYRRSSAALGKTIQDYERMARVRSANAEKPKACGGGQCRHRADCSDHYCPGRLSASLTGAHRP